MFTGIITGMGTVRASDNGRLAIATGCAPGSIAIGASVACDGCCLTVVAIDAAPGGSVLTFDVSNETMTRTTLSGWTEGRIINIERALKAGDELGGHIVTGHVDGTANVAAINTDGDSRRFVIEVTPDLAGFIAAKGSVALDGTSLTVNDVTGNRFTVNIIPHTLTVTTWGRKKPGDEVNLEVDLFPRYVARLMEHQK